MSDTRVQPQGYGAKATALAGQAKGAAKRSHLIAVFREEERFAVVRAVPARAEALRIGLPTNDPRLRFHRTGGTAPDDAGIRPPAVVGIPRVTRLF